MDSLKVLLTKPSGVADGVSVWEWCGTALDEGDDSSKWFTEYIGKPSRLVRFNAASETRPVDLGYARGHNIMFSDEYPFMLLSQVPTINQDTATAGPEPNETLMKVRSDKVLRPNDKQQRRIYFGLNLVCKESTEGNSKMVKVGDPVLVIQKVSSAAEAAP
ncbi:Molybdenum cofactor sulfurase family protein isoform 2 [Hibiscus syriacus]|uniref:Molybdenum cofactor sulfurase family protein isoform 2 n=1 Tax=Hibiscus syriacus TaxID=106335 RepID=A0A6A2WXR8_HIBSY|nr:Molybdenum cofactor sulfurase family protein isoform 2 [Hibiscus syriacus]